MRLVRHKDRTVSLVNVTPDDRRRLYEGLHNAALAEKALAYQPAPAWWGDGVPHEPDWTAWCEARAQENLALARILERD